MFRRLALLITFLALPVCAAAQVELSFYGGVQMVDPSDVTIRDDEIGSRDISVDWEGRSFEAPAYYGLRATRWQSAQFGFGIDFAHNKAYASDDTRPADIEVLEFTDGLNTLTVNAYHRWNNVMGEVTPYVGGGFGLAVPHVEVLSGSSDTSRYQVTGPAATWIAGASLPINTQWSVFGEYKGTYTANMADLDSGGRLETDVVTNAVNVGVSFNF